ncbi:MAG TPA: HPP family protein [Burkholderiaceae bacterium]|nr:HPP family protein [Burkholderiaceae bacterium]
MSPVLPNWLQALLPAPTMVDGVERLRSCAGAGIGILLTGLLSAAVLGPNAAAIWLVAPMGASAVLLFAAPASPLAQPWSLIGGNVVAALIGVTCAKLIDQPFAAATAAIFFAIGLMFVLRCLHPPSGAVALTAVLGGPAVHAIGYGFVLAPVLLNSFVILGVALFYNRATGRRYPHTQQLVVPHPHRTADVPPTARLGFTPDDLKAVMREYNQVLDISADDLDELFRKTEAHALRRRFGDTRCADIMSRDVVSVEFATELAEAWRLMLERRLQALPVVSRQRHVLGIVTRSDFLRHVELPEFEHFGARLRAFLRRTPGMHSDKHEVVGQIMTGRARTATDDTPITTLVRLMSDEGLHHVPIVDAHRQLVGMVTQTDLIAALYETRLADLQTAEAA